MAQNVCNRSYQIRHADSFSGRKVAVVALHGQHLKQKVSVVLTLLRRNLLSLMTILAMFVSGCASEVTHYDAPQELRTGVETYLNLFAYADTGLKPGWRILSAERIGSLESISHEVVPGLCGKPEEAYCVTIDPPAQFLGNPPFANFIVYRVGSYWTAGEVMREDVFRLLGCAHYLDASGGG